MAEWQYNHSITILSLVFVIIFIVSTSNAFILAEGSSHYHFNTQSSHLQQMSLFPTTSKYHTNQGDGLKQHRRWLVVDFDGTCTEKDTTPLLPYLAAAYCSTCHQRDKEDCACVISHEKDLQNRLSQFKVLEDEYMRLLGETHTNLFSDNDKGGEEEVESQSNEVLHALDDPSIQVTKMVSDSRLLGRLGHATSHEISEILYDDKHNNIQVSLKDGCSDVLARILLNKPDAADMNQSSSNEPLCSGWSLAVLSINWCPSLIDAALIQPLLKKRRSILQIEYCDTEIPVWSNRVDEEGVVLLEVPGALAKRDRIKELRRHIHENDENSGSSSIIIYVGDSTTDLAALLEADIGIIIGESSSIMAIAERYGVNIIPLKKRVSSDSIESSREKKILWQVDRWSEIDELLLEVEK